MNKKKVPYFWLAWKILRYPHNPTLQKFSILISIIAIAVGVASLIITLGVVNGFHHEIKSRILGLSPHVFMRLAEVEPRVFKISGKELIDRIRSKKDHVKGVSPFFLGQAILRTGRGSLGVMLKAVDPMHEGEVTRTKDLIIKGKWLEPGHAQAPQKRTQAVPIIIGSELAENLAVTVGSELLLLAPGHNSALAMTPAIYKAYVKGIFRSGYYEYDSSFALIDAMKAYQLRNLIQSAWIGVKGSDIEKSKELSDTLKAEFADEPAVARIVPWSEINKSLFSALKLEKMMLSLVISLIIFVATVGIASNLILIGSQKTKMLGSLRSLGVSRKELSHLILSLGAILGILGSILGLIISCPIYFLIKYTEIVHLPPAIYMLESLPIRITAGETMIVVILAWILSVIVSIIPAYQTAKLEVSQILRYG
ncbi:ABC transporter permease [Elusimicrobiota bacterium]